MLHSNGFRLNPPGNVNSAVTIPGNQPYTVAEELMRRAAWRLACLWLAMALWFPNRVSGQLGLPDVFDASVGGLSNCGAKRLAEAAEPGSDHSRFLTAVISFVEFWERWRQAYNTAAKTSDRASLQRDLRLWQEVSAAGWRLQETAYAREKLTAVPEPPPLTPPEHSGFQKAAWDFTSSWYVWLSRHVTHVEKGTSDLEALRGDAVLFQESMRLFRAIERLRPMPETP
jgi:hypothetical protein